MTNSTIYKNLKNQLKRSYSPYSHFKTAAMVVTDLGEFYGCNIENASYSVTVCAERCAIFNAIAHGAKTFKSLYLISSSNKNDIIPCGSCMQVISEWFKPNDKITVFSNSGLVKTYKVKDLLPITFTKKELANAKK